MHVVRRFEVQGTTNGRFDWQSVADSTGQVVARSKENYSRQDSAVRSAKREASLYPPGSAVVVIVED